MTTTSAVASKCWLKKPIRALLLDITGVLYESGTTVAIPGSIEAIKKLRAAGIPFRLITNETQRTTPKLIEKLASFGYDFQEQEVITPAMMCKKYLLNNKLRPHLLVHPNILPEFEVNDSLKPANCVVIGDADDYFTFNAINKCFQLLMQWKNQSSIDGTFDENDLLISLGRNKYYRENDKLKMDLGGFTAALEYATDLKARIIGKPSKEYFQAALDSLGTEFSKDDLAMIGDDIIGDVKGAQDFGIRGILVRTGKYMPAYENHCSVKPDAIVDNLLCAIDQIITQQG